MRDFRNLMWEGKLKNFGKILFLSGGPRAFDWFFASILPILMHKMVYTARYAQGIFNQHFTARERLLGEQKKDDSVHELWFWVETRIRRNLEASKENEKNK